jgi:hypothetical protein
MGARMKEAEGELGFKHPEWQHDNWGFGRASVSALCAVSRLQKRYPAGG